MFLTVWCLPILNPVSLSITNHWAEPRDLRSTARDPVPPTKTTGLSEARGALVEGSGIWGCLCGLFVRRIRLGVDNYTTKSLPYSPVSDDNKEK